MHTKPAEPLGKPGLDGTGHTEPGENQGRARALGTPAVSGSGVLYILFL